MKTKLSSNARELKLFINNDEDIYRSMLVPTYKSLDTAKKNKIYKTNIGLKFFLSLVRYGCAAYRLQIDKDRLFKLSEQMQVAHDLLEDWETEYENGQRY